MNTLFVDFLERMEFLYQEIRNDLARLPEEALDWSPAEDMNSIGILLTHLVGAAQYWACDMPAGGDSTRVRSIEFEAAGTTHAQLQDLLETSMVRMKASIATLTLADLEREVSSAMFAGETFTVSWCLMHAMEHSATHVGHIQLMRHYWQNIHTSA